MQVLEEGQKFERYQIQRHLGSSASGLSYEAEDMQLLRKVTFKQIHPWGILSDGTRREFFREMQDISALAHPYLAAVLDYGEVDGQLYIARRYVTPGSLLGSEGRYWFQPPLDVANAVRYICQLAEALQYIHDSGYAHGALTFANILVLGGPRADQGPDFAPFLIADIGSTHFVRRFGQLQTSLLPITAAPEQFGGRLTVASDQYALAVILYYWLTGRPPFLGTPDEIERLKLTETITTLTSVNLNVPLELEGVIRRALSVYPEDRYISMRIFTDALRASIARVEETGPLMLSQNGATARIEMETEQIPRQDSSSILEFLASVGQQEVTPVEVLHGSQPLPPEPSPHVAQDVPQSLSEPVELLEVTPEAETDVQFEHVDGSMSNFSHSKVDTQLERLEESALELPQPILEPKPIPPVDDSMPILENADDSDIQEESSVVLWSSLLISSPFSEKPHEIILEREETTLGRAGSSDILLDQDVLTSRHHALLKHEGDHYEIYDLRSANGIMVNEQKIPDEKAYVLHDGDRITIGEYELVFRTSVGAAFMTPD